jgi:putative salt-induced outer membrane protein
MFRNAVLIVMLVFWSAEALSQAEAPEEETSPWAGTASLGYLSTAGNTDTTSYNTAFEVSYTHSSWVHTLTGAANGADESDTTTAEAYQAGWKSDYNFSETSFLFGQLNWRKDRFSGVDQQTSAAAGYGRRLIDTPEHLFLDFADNTSGDSAILTLGMKYIWTFSETSNFQQDIAVESGSDNTFIESVSAVRARLLGDFAIVFSYTVRHNTDVPVDSKNTDRLTAVSLEYAF